MTNLSQNFLCDSKFIEKFISYLDFSYPIIEIGCGNGVISKEINPDLCIEIDKKFIPNIRQYNLVISDARYLPVYRGSIISSFPYSITEVFFEEVIKNDKINSLLLILQKDFVDKIMTYPTFISFILNYYYRIIPKDIIPPKAFCPSPKVFSQIVLFTKIRHYDPYITKILKCITKYRNKKIKNAASICGIKANEEKKVRDFRPCQISELLKYMGLTYA
ncbi:16S ribosomal RNA methyltransferase A [Acidianus brierleyi]|uniref:16S ribosomal RNA methyltransferase A n=1 Tax=Acidianus brierleyi TaxID=41673 RepID=A0A2U9IEN5_9CREN|nr:16S ribosomal RNA methyltransferase A [Acidianus brierleyi]AWR94426.1 16S ribosomal RNA methyltransferase A [Acidianus brierleyi]